MIESTLEFEPRALAPLVDALLTLPNGLHPTRYSVGENDKREPIPDRETLIESDVGFFLAGTKATFDVRPAAGNRPLVCDCYFEDFEGKPHVAKSFLVHMASARPTFGFACAPEEYLHRNRIIIKHGVNTVESWVGRNTRKYIPGFYWMTLLPESLARRHGVPLSTVDEIAQEHTVLHGSQHLFRFYEQPEDWRASSRVAQLCASLRGVFDVESVKPGLAFAKNLLELDTMLAEWD